LGFAALIVYQDFRERAVLWVLFPIIAFTLLSLHLYHSDWRIVLYFSLTNVLLVSGMLLVLFLYSKHIMKKEFLNVSFGLGDVLFLYAFALGFPTVTFLILCVSALLFSLLLFTFLKPLQKTGTVPLAGLMSLFLIGIHIATFLPFVPSLYQF